MKKEIYSKIRCALFFIVLYASWMIPCFMKYQEDKDIVNEEVFEFEEDIICWKQDDVEEVYVEEIEIETVTEPQVKFYNVPLSKEIQLHIFAECEKHNIAPALVIALIERESRFDVNAISHYGDKGLMQVSTKWQYERMERLGCLDLYNPFQNVTVGIDYLAELKSKNQDLYWVLMAYNQGMDKATERIKNEDYSSYAIGIVERASELETENENIQSMVE